MPEPASAATILAFDYGLRRIGVAVGQTVTGSASPLPPLPNGALGPDPERIRQMVREWRPSVLVVGLPLRLDGNPSEMSVAATAFAKSLECFDRPVVLVDERHTSAEAGAELKRARQAGTRGRIRKEHVDAAAAVLIAERYLEHSIT